jgi:PhnB protein
MEFYRSCFGGELSVIRVGDSPMSAQVPAAFHDRVVNARLASGAIDISGPDWMHPTRTP